MAIQQNIQQAIKNFYALTNTSFLYYQTGVLIDRFNILNDIQSISGYLQRLNFSELCIFPLIIENQLSGFLSSMPQPFRSAPKNCIGRPY